MYYFYSYVKPKELRIFCTLQQETEVGSTEDIADHIKRLSIGDASFVLGSLETTSTASSVGGEVVLGGNKKLRLLNAFLGESDVKTIDSQQLEWNQCADRTKRLYIQQTRDVLVAVLNVVSPQNAGYLWMALQASKAVNDELGVEDILHPSVCTLRQ